MKSFAYKMGQVSRGLNNPESAISSSYNAGKNSKAKKKQSLF